jgi:hypothetical protein
LTIAFFGANGNCANGGGQPASSISFTTPSYNVDNICFNIDELFTQGNNTGRKSGSPSNDLPPPFSGVNYTLAGRELYQSNMNYTGVWIKSTNITGVGEGMNGGRVVTVFEGRNCLDVKPFFSLSCQTAEGGRCQNAPSAFRSFSLDDAYPYIQSSNGKCESFAPHSLNAASTLSGRASLLVAGLTITMALWMSL